MTPTTRPPETIPDRSPPRVARCQIVQSAADAPQFSARYPLAAALLILGWVVLNLAYLAFDCPLDLAPDEAHYWHWSRHLDWSYYSKGPLVAWLIRGSCELFGGLSVRLVGSEVLAVRLPAVLSSAALLAGLYVLLAGVLRDRRSALAAVALALALPPVTAGAVVMTIDPPFLACWCWALVGVWKAIAAGSRYQAGWWVLAGTCSALGVLAKYPMLLQPLAVLAFLLARRRAEFRQSGFWVYLGLTAVGCIPILVWNTAHDWVSFRHVLGQAGIQFATRSYGVRWFGPLEFAAGQFALLLGFWFVAIAAAAWKYRRASDTGLSLMWWSAVPVWAVFFLASLHVPGQLNWPAAAYIGGSVLAAAWLRERRRFAGWLVLVVLLGLVLSVGVRYPRLAQSLLARVVGPPTDANPTPIRKMDPTCRLRGWRMLAAEVDRIRDLVKAETGDDPVLAGMVWTTPGELSFYCRGHPGVYSFGPALADRHSQYDLWRPNPVADAQAFRGRSFVYVGDEIPRAAEVFERIESPVRVVHAEDGVPVAAWMIWVGHGFRGFPPRQTPTGY